MLILCTIFLNAIGIVKPVGVATGSDVSEQAADMILSDNSFASIVTGVELA
jgi:magnesium-transporting ATPase (P-type)